MNVCPTHDLLQRLLAEQLEDAERRGVEEHVEDCGRCQEELRHLVDADSLFRARGPARAPPPGAPDPGPEDRTDFAGPVSAAPLAPSALLPRPAGPGGGRRPSARTRPPSRRSRRCPVTPSWACWAGGAWASSTGRWTCACSGRWR
jgi:hypothetical protein